MSAQISPNLELIEHLDFTPICEVRPQSAGGSCGGVNPAAYIATYEACHPSQCYICSDCVTVKARLAPTLWLCVVCNAPTGIGEWLDFITLHPLGRSQ